MGLARRNMQGMGKLLPVNDEDHMTAGITVEQFRKLGSGRRRISKSNIEKLERGEDPVPDEDTEGELVNDRFVELLLTDHDIKHTSKPGIMEFSHLPNETGVSSARVQARKSKQGTRPGVPDYFAAIRNDKGEKSLVWIELKKERGKNG